MGVKTTPLPIEPKSTHPMEINEASSRSAILNDRPANDELITTHHYSDNSVFTAKYTPTSFVPKTLFEFFRVVANQYFLWISLLQVLTGLSPTNKYTTAGPLVVILMMSMLKQGIEDKRRHKADAIQNARQCTVISAQGEHVGRPWHSVQVGDILFIKENEELPADVVILGTSEEEGACFVETCNLDGETNLKRKTSIECTSKALGVRKVNEPPLDEKAFLQKATTLKGKAEYEQPNNRLYNFTGTLDLQGAKSEAIRPCNVILRGCSLKSAEYALGFVIYTGSDTKLMQNARSTPSKQSNVYLMVNRCITVIFFTQFMLCLISTISTAVWVYRYKNVWYLESEDHSDIDTILSFFTFLILYNNLVPISLYVSLDMIKVIQAKFISNDPEMVHEGFSAIARTSDLNEELGQIEYIFSDKTGTLTRNIMEFRKCSIGSIAYGMKDHESGTTKAQVDDSNHINFHDPRLLNDLARGGTQADLIHEFLVILSVCHTVIPENDPATGEVHYRASSPDEEALIKAAKCLGYDFRTPAPKVEVNIKDREGNEQVMKYEILNINEFNSTRKRMSVVVRNPEGKIVLYCKGADNMMLARSKKDDNSGALQHNISIFALEGLRTLVLARRELEDSEYQEWDEKYRQAATSLIDRDEKLDDVAEVIEVEMDIVGATAIEDKLQEGVPEAIKTLSQAGIKVWVLTGDKEETAINIGYSCQLLNHSMKLMMVNASTREKLEQTLETLRQSSEIRNLLKKKQSSNKIALVCDGKALVHVFHDSTSNDKVSPLMSKLLEVSSCCRAVIACRVSPAQKADIVSLVRENIPSKPITLAIGDGANDVNMIQTAHVGVGICGQEGVQAVNNSDYAIAQFRFLIPLLLKHGRANYKRISKVILYSFYKNIALVVVLFLYNFDNGQSGTSLFESFVMAGWNFFLALPIIVIGIYDEDIPPEMVLSWPKLYIDGQHNADLNVRSFITWILNAFFHGILCYFLPYLFTNTFWEADGTTSGVYFYGTVVYSGLLMTMNCKVMLETLSWNKWHYWTMAFSIFLFFFFLLTYPHMTFVSYDMFGVGMALLNSSILWLTFALVPFFTILVDVTEKYLSRNYKPTPSDILREMTTLGINHKIASKDIEPSPEISTTDTRLPVSATRLSVAVKTGDNMSGAIRNGSDYKGFVFSAPMVTQTVIDEEGHSHVERCRSLAAMKVIRSRE